MQKPFIDLEERGIEYNLAHIGFTIAHEMSHSLDNFGSQYDYKGNLYDWWTSEDKLKFKKLQTDVINQYEDWSARDGIKFDASIGIGEDLADISGLAICDEYLRDFQKKNDDIMPIRYLSYQVFYTYFSMQMRQKVGKKALAAQLKSNPHPLDKYRTNVPLSRSFYFNSVYNVKKGDEMWWHNKNTIW
jgi:predicted metalloendopeptidase